ncbi:MAG: hypothetical protein KDC38_13920, partial [Planctomycetes bacterium]|nr:hypothetical protein [Planctomycetota bacterium]
MGPTDRERFLANLEDPGLRAEVASLLSCEEDEAPFLEPERRFSLAGALPSVLESDEVETDAPAESILLPGSRVGAYELEERIGSGGMGEVYRARRIDGAFQRRV